jgi:hypothetical protein
MSNPEIRRVAWSQLSSRWAPFGFDLAVLSGAFFSPI